MAYVESYDDIAFWRTLLSEFENEERYFQVMLPSATSLAKGKKMVLMNTLNTSELGRSLIVFVEIDLCRQRLRLPAARCHQGVA